MDQETKDFLQGMMNELQEFRKETNNRFESLEAGQKDINLKLDGLTDEVARLREDVTVLKSDSEEMKIDLRLVKIATVEHSNEIEKLKIIK
jgi:uncharacterized coiled-coil DUF342 family protein